MFGHRFQIQKSKANKSNEIVPEIAHLIENNKGSSTTTQMDTASVTVTTFDNLSELAAPWRKEETEENEEEEDSSEEESEEEEEVPGMSMKSATVEKVVIGTKEKKAINKAAVRELQKTKAFKAKEKMRAKKQRSESKFKEKRKTLSKKDKHMRKIKGKEKVKTNSVMARVNPNSQTRVLALRTTHATFMYLVSSVDLLRLSQLAP